MECAGCDDEGIHKKKTHSTKRIKTVLNEVISSAFEEEDHQKKNTKDQKAPNDELNKLLEEVEVKIYQIQKGKMQLNDLELKF